MIKVRTLAKGEKITEPGVYNLSIDAYHGQPCDGPSISSSGLRKIFKESPAHYWATSSLNPLRVEAEETAALTLGRACHHLLLGEDDFSTMFVVRPDMAPDGRDWNGNNRTCKDWLAEQALAGRTVLTPGQIETIRGMAKSLAAHPLVQAGILNGEIEKSIFWKDRETGIWLKCRPDAIPNDSGDFADLKSTTSVRTEALERTIVEFGYPQQGALINAGAHEVLGTPDTSFSLVFVESKIPHCTRIVTLKDVDLARAERQNAAALRIFAKCLASGEWPGPGGADAEDFGIPSWEAKKIDNALEFMEAE